MSGSIPVVIDLLSNVENGSDEETTHNRVKGSLHLKGQTTYIKYEELTEDEEKVRNVLKIYADEVTILRSGPVSMHQRFQQGRATEGHYGTPFGTMHMKTVTERLDYEWRPSEGTGEIGLTYQLKMQGNDLGRVTLSFTIREAAAHGPI